MAKKGSGAPQIPDPQETADAQTKSNIDTAKAQASLNYTNQVTPWGDLTYTKTEGEDGVPQYTATQTLSPVAQALFDKTAQMNTNLADLGVEQSGRLSGLLDKPFSLDNDATEGRIMDLARKRLDPMLEDRRAALQTELVNRGIRPGSEAYSKAMMSANQGENDAYNQILLDARGQSVAEALLERQTPLNEIIALASGTQMQSPNYVSTPQTGVAGTDIAGITNNAYTQQWNAYNQRQQQQQSTLGGLFGLGANALMAFSDKRLKKNIKPTGAKVAGVPVKSWNWKSDGHRDVGVIAQDVEKKHPHLVDRTDPSGYRRVNYSGLMKMGAERAA